MNFDIENINQSTAFIDTNIFYSMYKNLHEISKKTPSIRFISPFIGLADGLISTAQAAAGIAEAIFKGFVNILGAPFSTNCDMKRGFLQLAGGFFIFSVSLPIIVFRVLKISICFFKDSERLALAQLDKYKFFEVQNTI